MIHRCEHILLIPIIIDHTIPLVFVYEHALVDWLEHVSNEFDLLSRLTLRLTLHDGFTELMDEAASAHQLILGLDPVLSWVAQVVVYEISNFVNLGQVIFFSAGGHVT